jgi:hypothetical protein
MPASSPVHLILLDLIILIIFGEKVMELLIMQFSSTSYFFITPRSKYSPQHLVFKYLSA